MIVYNIIFALLYAVGAYLSANALTFLMAFDIRPFYTIEIVYSFGIAVAVIVLREILMYFGRRKQYLTKYLMIGFCIIDLISYGSVFFVTMFWIGGSGLLNYLDAVTGISLFVAAYWILVSFLVYRIYVTCRYFTKRKSE